MKMRVSSKSNTKSLGGAIAGFFGENPQSVLELDCIGAGAVNAAAKGTATACYMLGERLEMTPRFEPKPDVQWIPRGNKVHDEMGVTGIIFEIVMRQKTEECAAKNTEERV